MRENKSAVQDLSNDNKIIKDFKIENKIELDLKSLSYRFSIVVVALILGIIGNFIGGVPKVILLCLAYFLLLKRVMFNVLIKIVKNHKVDEDLFAIIAILGVAFLDKNIEALLTASLYVILKNLIMRIIENTNKEIKKNDVVKEDSSNANMNQKTNLKSFFVKYNKYCFIIILGITALLFSILFCCGNKLDDCIYKVLLFLAISYPWSIIISFFIGWSLSVSKAYERKVFINDDYYLNALNNVKKIVFDKACFTNGFAKIKNIEISESEYKKNEILEMLVKGESLSTHPISKAFMKLSNGLVDNYDIDYFKEFPGKGISYKINGKKILVGSKKWCKCDIGNGLHMHIDGKHVASINIEDEIKINSEKVIKDLKKKKYEVYIFDNDKGKDLKDLENRLEISKIKYDSLPENKTSINHTFINNNLTLLVCKSVKDLSILNRFDIVVKVKPKRKDVTQESDVIFMSDNLRKLTFLLNLAHYLKRILIENLVLTIIFKIAMLIMIIMGIGNMFYMLLIDMFINLILIINTLRISNRFKS